MPSLRGSEYAAVVVLLDAARIPAEGRASVGEEVKPQPEVEGCSIEHPRELPGRTYARIARGPGLPDATVKRLLCSGRIRAIVTTGDDDGSSGAGERSYQWKSGVLDVGANRRLVSDKQLRALLIRDGGCCTVPGCGSRIGLEAHHVQHWLYGGKTIMTNLVLLCRAHHRAVHKDALLIQPLGNEHFRYLLPDGRELLTEVDRGPLAGLAPVEADHQHVAATAATTRWDGTPLDHDFAVATLAQGLASAARLRTAS